jgi:hypothetical protein
MVEALADFRAKLVLLKGSSASAFARTKCRYPRWDVKGTDMDASHQVLVAVRIDGLPLML